MSSLSSLFFLLTFVSYYLSPKFQRDELYLDVLLVMLNPFRLDTNLMSHKLPQVFSFFFKSSCFFVEVDVEVGLSSTVVLINTKAKTYVLPHLGTASSCPTICRTYDSLGIPRTGSDPPGILLPSNFTSHYNGDYYLQGLPSTSNLNIKCLFIRS